MSKFVRAGDRGTAPQAMVAVAAAMLLASTPSLAATLTNYDEFALSYIHPARWYGEEGKQYGGIRAEAQRVIIGGQLRIQAKGWGDNYTNTNSSTVRNSMILQKSSAITALGATVTARTVTASTCAANTTPSIMRARLFGFFFNAGSPQPGSNYNDVFAGIQLYRASNSTDGANVMRVSAFVGQCTDDSCIASTILVSQDMGTTTVGTAVPLQMVWEPANNRFVFQRDAQTPINLAYTVSDTQPASFPVKRLEVSNQIAHCTAVRTASNGVADFDNVQTNTLTGLQAQPLRSLRAEALVAPAASNEVGRVD
jgi:hypothetical protein